MGAVRMMWSGPAMYGARSVGQSAPSTGQPLGSANVSVPTLKPPPDGTARVPGDSRIDWLASTWLVPEQVTAK